MRKSDELQRTITTMLEQRPMTIAEIADGLEKSRDVLYKIMNRGMQLGLFKRAREKTASGAYIYKVGAANSEDDDETLSSFDYPVRCLNCGCEWIARFGCTQATAILTDSLSMTWSCFDCGCRMHLLDIVSTKELLRSFQARTSKVDECSILVYVGH